MVARTSTRAFATSWRCAATRRAASACVSAPPEGYRNAADLVRGIREMGDFEISVSAYPERHPESVSIEEDLAFMADKAEHGATRAISQFFFHNAFFLRLRTASPPAASTSN